MSVGMDGDAARAPGCDGVSDTGLYEFNRLDLSVAEVEARKRSWSEGDLFAVFRDELGGMRAQYARYEDYFEVAVTQLVRSRGHSEVTIDREMALFLVGILMVSRIHGYEFDNFLELRDHNNEQVFDMRRLCNWIGRNEYLFMTSAQAAMEEVFDDDDMELLRNGDAEHERRLMEDAR